MKVIFIPQLSQHDFNKTFSYITGVIFGDGHINEYLKKGHKTPKHTITLSNTDLDFLTEYQIAISNLLGLGFAKIRKYSSESGYKPQYVYSRHSHWLYHLLNRNLSKISDNIHYPLFFLKGLFDSEGCVSYTKSKNRLYKALTISTTSIEIKEYVQKILKQHGISFTISNQKTHKKQMKDGHWLIPHTSYTFMIKIGKKQAIQRFAEIMPKLIPRKQEKLEQLLVEMSKRGFIDAETGKKIASEESKLKASEARKKYWERNPQEKKRAAEVMSKTISKCWKNLSYRQLQIKRSSEQLRKRWINPKFRKHMSEVISENKKMWWEKHRAKNINC